MTSNECVKVNVKDNENENVNDDRHRERVAFRKYWRVNVMKLWKGGLMLMGSVKSIHAESWHMWLQVPQSR